MKDLHRKVHFTYKITLLLLTALIAFIAPNSATLIFCYSTLWILMEDIERVIEKMFELYVKRTGAVYK